VAPPYNERENIAPLGAHLDAALGGIAWEAVFVDDDSADGTATAVQASAVEDRRVRRPRRIRAGQPGGRAAAGARYEAANQAPSPA
jgi:dolichol-phosphate mannosyltransferase